ncbi:hypothetical protein C8R44DRAFT_890738 [Mycena epipterygia]|nr:hypothetical protein C8R44DRAFT_890738 [Mycena epipterygia]
MTSTIPATTPSTSVVTVSTDSKLPDGWKEFVHMNGTVYYTFDHHRLLTQDDVYNPKMRLSVLEAYRKHHGLLKQIHDSHPHILDAEMLVFHAGSSARVICASWIRGMIYNRVKYPGGKRVVPGSKAEFWQRVWEFPMHRDYLPCFLEEQFLAGLAFGSNERVLNMKDTTFPFNDAEIQQLLRVYRDLKGLQRLMHKDLVPALCYHVGRVMFDIESARERNHYGTPHARLRREVVLHKPTWKVIIWDLFIGVVLCGTHSNYRTRLESTVPKGSVSLPDFRQLVHNLLSEWADSNLVATVLVSVNVGFFSVPEITGLQRAFSLVSSLCAMASMVTGLHHVWQHRDRTDTELQDARQYLYYLKLCFRRTPKHKELTPLDLTLMACILALPLATLQWSVLSFTLAIAAFAFTSTAHTAAHVLLLVLLPLLVALACGAVVFFWQIWSARAAREVAKEPDAARTHFDASPGWQERFRSVRRSVREKWISNGAVHDALRMRNLRHADTTV